MSRQQTEITALYCRLSQDDGSEGLSNSIKNQKDYLLSYAKEHHLPNPTFYVDDGWSGTTYDRPDFKRMSDDIDKGLVKTVVVKDLSRFGREHIHMEYLYEVQYLEKGVRFIAIMDNVDTGSEDSNEFAAFTNLFNEWYPKTTSKKVKAVKKAKGLAGEHLGAAPYGYLKNPDDPKRWLVDAEAAKIVRRIFTQYMNGTGISAIADGLWQDKVLTPSAYKQSKGIGVAKPSADPYGWDSCTVIAILDNVAYTGVTEAFKSVRVGFRSKKRIPTGKEDRAYIKDAHEAIIAPDVWEKVQLRRGGKHRPTKSGEMSLFSGLLYCADCGAKLSFHASSGRYRFFRCCKYKRNSRGKVCTQHYIREDVLSQLVLKQLQGFLAYLGQFEKAFVKRQMEQAELDREIEREQLQEQFDAANRRLKELDLFFRRIYEDNVTGKLTDAQFFTLSAGYEAEQRELKEKIQVWSRELEATETAEYNISKFIAIARKYTHVEELTPELLNALVDRIEVHEAQRVDGKRTQEIEIHYSYVGVVNLPTAEELDAAAKERNSKTA